MNQHKADFGNKIKTNQILDDWNNKYNYNYYDSFPLKDLQGFAAIAGLTDYSDLKIIERLITSAKSIAEIGAGYGRVIDHLFKLEYKGLIYAIERSEKFCELLKQKKYPPNYVTLIQTDILNLNIQEKCDLVLWMWSGISDFAKHEQLQAIQQIGNIVNKGGKFIIETLSHEISPINASFSTNQSYAIPGKNCVVYGYIPSQTEIKQYANQSGFTSIEYISYKTSTQRLRSMYILTK